MAEGKINANLRISDGTTDYKTLKELCVNSITAFMSGRSYLQGGNRKNSCSIINT